MRKTHSACTFSRAPQISYHLRWITNSSMLSLFLPPPIKSYLYMFDDWKQIEKLHSINLVWRPYHIRHVYSIALFVKCIHVWILGYVYVHQFLFFLNMFRATIKRAFEFHSLYFSLERSVISMYPLFFCSFTNKFGIGWCVVFVFGT